MDDGKPGTGTLWGRGGTNGITNCTTASTDTSAAAQTAEYKLTNSAINCSFMFRNLY